MVVVSFDEILEIYIDGLSMENFTDIMAVFEDAAKAPIYHVPLYARTIFFPETVRSLIKSNKFEQLKQQLCRSIHLSDKADIFEVVQIGMILANETNVVQLQN